MDERTTQRERITRTIDAAWPDLFTNLQAAYADLVNTRLTLEKQAAELQDVNELLQDVIASMSEGLFILDTTNRIARANLAALEMIGVGEAECLGKTLADFFPDPEVPGTVWQVLRRSERGVIIDYETRLRRRDGRIIPVSLSASIMRDPTTKITGLLVTAADITERKRAEVALRRAHDELELRVQQRTEELEQSREQLRQLSARLQQIREEERTRIAREIHDQLGGAMTALKMDLDRLSRDLGQEDEAATAEVNMMMGALDETIQLIRRIASDLRPSVLDTWGLPAAIEWQLEEFQRRSGIQCRLNAAVDEVDIKPDTATAVFRVFQETLTNVARHAQATEVAVSLEEVDNQLVLKVCDNGRGINESELAKKKSLGLLGMRERMRLVSGEIRFQGAPGEGTTVTLTAPLQAEAPSGI